MLSRDRTTERGKTDNWGWIQRGEKNRRNSIENRNKSISVNHPSPAICLHLDTTQMTREDNNNWIQFFINTFQFLNRSTELFFSLYLARLYPRRKQKMTKKRRKKEDERKGEKEKRGGCGRKQHMVKTSLHCGSVILLLAAAPSGIHSMSIKGILSSHFCPFKATGLKKHIRLN